MEKNMSFGKTLFDSDAVALAYKFKGSSKGAAPPRISVVNIFSSEETFEPMELDQTSMEDGSDFIGIFSSCEDYALNHDDPTPKAIGSAFEDDGPITKAAVSIGDLSTAFLGILETMANTPGHDPEADEIAGIYVKSRSEKDMGAYIKKKNSSGVFGARQMNELPSSMISISDDMYATNPEFRMMVDNVLRNGNGLADENADINSLALHAYASHRRHRTFQASSSFF